MFYFFSSFLSRPPKNATKKQNHCDEDEDEDEEGRRPKFDKNSDMPSACIASASPACIQTCCLTLTAAATADRSKHPYIMTATEASRHNFVSNTKNALLFNTYFTNHESLPSFSDAFADFIAAYPRYADTEQADQIRDYEYYHLSSHTCLDYTGFSLFSRSQLWTSSLASSSTSALRPMRVPSFTISYKSASLKSQVQYGNQETAVESVIRKRIMSFLNMSGDEYSMVCTANRTTAFKLIAECYPFRSNRRLLTVYDYESEAVTAMAEAARKKGAKVDSAVFCWPSLRIDSSKLKQKVSARSKSQGRGLFVFPLQSRMTGARYPYLWMSNAQENGWHVVLDASALGPKDMDTLGLSLIQPDFIVCSFFKVFGENPSGFAAIFIKKSVAALLESSPVARSIGMVSIVPTTWQSSAAVAEEDDFSGPSKQQQQQQETGDEGSLNKRRALEQQEIVELQGDAAESVTVDDHDDKSIEFRGLDHADGLGLPLINCRLRYIVNWLVNALTKLRHPNSERGHSLVRIYGPKIKFDRAPAVAFNVFDWKGEKVEPALVQKLADRSSISLSCGFLQHVWFKDKYEQEKSVVMERRVCEISVLGNKRKETVDVGITVVNAAFGFLSNFEDAYRLWAFVAKFLDADFVEKERWRYMALNQKMIEV